MLEKKYFVESLRSLGIQHGDCVHVQSDLGRIGMVEGARSRGAVLEFYLEGLREVIGEEGTISVPTFVFSGPGDTFVVEETPAQTGPLAECIRRSPAALRSCHPIFSVAALGPKAEEITAGPHLVGYGYCSPWGKLHQLNAKILSLGIATSDIGGTSFFHYCETLFNVPYRYSKILNRKVYKSGKLLAGPFIAYVRYRGLQGEQHTGAFREKLIGAGHAKRVPLGTADAFCIPAQAMFHESMKALSTDPFALGFTPEKVAPDCPMIEDWGKGEY